MKQNFYYRKQIYIIYIVQLEMNQPFIIKEYKYFKQWVRNKNVSSDFQKREYWLSKYSQIIPFKIIFVKQTCNQFRNILIKLAILYFNLIFYTKWINFMHIMTKLCANYNYLDFLVALSSILNISIYLLQYL